jgi:hypothetical protein
MVQVVLPLLQESDDIQWVVDILVTVELSLDITIPKDAELGRQMDPVGPEDLTVECERRNECPLRGNHVYR